VLVSGALIARRQTTLVSYEQFVTPGEAGLLIIGGGGTTRKQDFLCHASAVYAKAILSRCPCVTFMFCSEMDKHAIKLLPRESSVVFMSIPAKSH